MSNEQLREAIRQKAVDGRVACSALLELAARSGVPAAEVGALCNEMKLKISACQLGCFG